MKPFSLGVPKRSALLFTALVVVALALTMSADTASMQTGQGRSGDWCLNTFMEGNCTAEDVPTTTYYSYVVEDPCMFPDDQTVVELILEVDPGSPDRYDISYFIALDGGRADSGQMCYQDYLGDEANALVPCSMADYQAGFCSPTYDPGAAPTASTAPIAGTSFWDAEGSADVCGDVEGGSGGAGVKTLYRTSTMTFACPDTDGDGEVDPIHVCVGWDNNQANRCEGIDDAFPGNKAKCDCGYVQFEPPLIIYDGLDFGDLPDGYAMTTLINEGARHVIQDRDHDYLPDTVGSVPAVWLGSQVDLEADGAPCPVCGQDDARTIDDEDGVITTGRWWAGSADGGYVDVTVATSEGTCPSCVLAFWIDWTGDGDFDDALEAHAVPLTAGSHTVTFETPNVLPGSVYTRFRLYDRPQVSYAPDGLVLNGEVEDYSFTLTPLAVILSSFDAVCQEGYPLLTWETVSELTNAGFNLYRNTSPAIPGHQLNAALIPSQAPGSNQGFVYTWHDITALPDTTYYYWLEDVSLTGVATLHGPVSATCAAPTAVEVLELMASSPALPLPASLPVGAVVAVASLALAAAWRRRTA